MILKFIHVATVSISIAAFMIRYLWMIQSSPMLQHRWVKITPHINDSFLLLSAIALAVFIAQYPISSSWLNAKIIALLLYIIFGSVALKRGKSKHTRIIAGLLSLLIFAYIVLVAFSKNAFVVF